MQFSYGVAMKGFLGIVLTALFAAPVCSQSPDDPPVRIDSVPADLILPEWTSGEPSPAARVRQVHPRWRGTEVYHALYLPTNFDRSRRYPVIVELAGNGGFRSALGDVCTGVPEGCKLGFGLTGGKDFIWVCLPYLNGDSTKIATRWWGDPPDFDVKPTLDYCKATVPWICEQFSGDPQKVILAGFSRGAIACNYVGLYDDEIAKLWCGFIAYSHYDGVRRWPYPGSDSESAKMRLKRLGDRPQLICHEGRGNKRGLAATKDWLRSTEIEGSFTFLETGFVNHNDAWTMRPSRARSEIRDWLQQFRE